MKRFLSAFCLGLLGISSGSSAERINHDGRVLGAVPVVTTPVLFNTPEADAIVSAMQIFPLDNPWNEDISRRPLLPNSDAMIAQIISELRSDRRTLRAFEEMNFVLAPDSQPMVPIDFFNYADESDPSPYPIPSNMPVETWPSGTGGLSLAQWQQDVNDEGGDRHSIIVQPGKGLIWETWLTKLNGGAWEASNGAKFDLKSNNLRPAGWTSGDAAGLPMFPALVRYDECERGMVEHAVRLVVKHTRRQYIYPATHHASVPSTTDPNIPAMGQRLRLKSSFTIPEGWTKQEKAILRGLKKYGAIIADNGNFFSISVTPDNRWPSGAFSHLSSLSITNFEVIQTTGPNEGPRSPGAPKAEAGPDQTAVLGQPITLAGHVTFGGARPAVQWRRYTGPAAVSFADATSATTTATFATPGVYTLMLSADDQIHTVAYDAVVVTVTDGLTVQIDRTDSGLRIAWAGGQPPFVLERASEVVHPQWETVLTTDSRNTTLPPGEDTGFFRVRGQ
jgi:hypothetical protein